MQSRMQMSKNVNNDVSMNPLIRSIYDVMDFTVKENIPDLMLFIDQKALDSVKWEFLFRCL